jgi:hypothetical protein
MEADAFHQIVCRPAEEIRVGDRIIQGFLITPVDVDFIRSVADSDLILRLVCPGRRALEVRPKSLLTRMVQVPHSGDWYISRTGTGPHFTKGD